MLLLRDTGVGGVGGLYTYYQHKRIYKGTWISPDDNTLNQIDHVIIDASKKGVTEDVRTMGGFNCDSDHF